MMKPVPKTSGGYGFAHWLPDGFMSAEEVRAVGERDLIHPDGECAMCHDDSYRRSERAHILRKGNGGKPKGTTGPTLRLCATCHDYVDEHGDVTLAIRRDGMVCLVQENGDIEETGVRV